MGEEERQQADSCQRIDVAAYLDGELDASESALFERHARECAACRDALAEQQRLLCLLDATFGRTPEAELALPKDFTEIVTAHAQTDMSGVRCSKERGRALLLCVALAAAAFALLGASTFDETLASLATLAQGFASVVGMIGHAVVDAGASASVILRAGGGSLVDAPGRQGFLAWMFLAGAVALLLWLIGSYHRMRVPD